MTSIERPGWLHHVQLGEGWVITEQLRTVAAQRFRRPDPELSPDEDEFEQVRRVLARMLTV